MRGIHAMSEAESLFMLAALRVLLPLHDAIAIGVRTAYNMMAFTIGTFQITIS